MPTIRNQIVSAFCTKISAERALRFSNADRLPMRVVWDAQESAEKVSYGKYNASMDLAVQVMLDAGAPENTGLNEGALLDAALASLQVDALTFDQAFDDLINTISYGGSDYEYSQDGNSLVALTAVFTITYQFTI